MDAANATVIMFIIALIIFGPLLFIWSLNTLFGLGIAFTLKTWFAALLLAITLSVKRSSSK